MTRKGRKRKPGPRTPSGALKRSKQDAKVTVLAQPHRAWLPERQRVDQKAVDELGRMFLAGRLFAKQQPPERAEVLWAAGQQYQSLMVSYRRAIGAPYTGRSAGFDYVSEGANAPQPSATDTDEERYDRVCRALDEATAALKGWAATPHAATVQKAVLDAVCLRNEAILRTADHILHDALAALAWLWKLDRPQATTKRNYVWRNLEPMES